MPRQLKTFTTSIGFYDLAIAAPSMKAALEAWGSPQNLFHLGLARQTDDPDAVAATMAKPGAVLRRAVGTTDIFRERPEPPTSLAADVLARPQNAKAAKPRKAAKPDNEAQKAAVIQFEKEKAKRQKAHAREKAQREKQEAADARDAQRRRMSVDKAKAALETGRERHEAKVKTLEDKLQAERDRWEKEGKKLMANVRKARE